MVITKSTPFTKLEINQLKERFEVYIKTTIDMKKKVCCAGSNLHSDGEKILLDSGSSQSDIWGGGIDIETKTIDYNAIINIRPNQNNPSDEIQDPLIKQQYTDLSKYFFKALYE